LSSPVAPLPNPPPPEQPHPAWWQRLHAALMPDYNRKATAYWWVAVLGGACVILWALLDVARQPPLVWVQVAAGTLIAMLAGGFPVRIPHSKNSFAAGEVFILLLLLMHGPSAAVLAAAGEAFVGSMRTSKRWTSRIASPAMAGLAMVAAGSMLMLLVGGHARLLTGNAAWVIPAAMLFSLVYFVLNITLVTTVYRLKANAPFEWSPYFMVFGWVGIAFAGSAAVASLLFLVYRQTGIGVLMGMLPLLAMLLATLHYFFRQQEAAEAARQASAEAAARHAELAARHMRELEASERRFHSAFTHASIGMALLSFDGRILQANPALRVLLGERESSLVHHPFQEFVVEEDRARLLDQLGRIDAAGD
jgi:PAS domain-containing protein